MPKQPLPLPTPPDCRESLGQSPALLAKRDGHKINQWCPNRSDTEYDRWCNPNHPKTIHFRHVKDADEILKDIVNPTPLLKSKCCKQFNIELYFKVETSHKTGSFHERSAIYALLMLSEEERSGGVYTASLGNWALALAYQGSLLEVPVTVVLPIYTSINVVYQCQTYGATVVLHGTSLSEAKKRAFILIAEQGYIGTYLNGYDNPNVIAGAGTIGIEILRQLPNTDAILVPVGGGGLIAGIAAYIKHIKPEIQIYGIQPGQSCSFFKAMDNERPYQTEPERGLASSLTVAKPGDNAFHTAQSLIDKMVLVHDDWIARAVLHLTEEETLIAEGAGAISLGALMCLPNVVPELQGKKVVCIVSGGNISILPLIEIYARAKTVEGRIVTLTMHVGANNYKERNKILRVIENIGCNVNYCEVEREWLTEDKLLDNYMSLQCETRDMNHARTLKRVLEKLFPNTCEFSEEIFEPTVTCTCFPKKNIK